MMHQHPPTRQHLDAIESGKTKQNTKSGLELSSSSGGEAGESPPTFNNVAPPPPNMFSAAAPKKTEEKSKKKKKTKSGLELSSSSGDEAGESPPTFNNVAPPPVNMFSAAAPKKTEEKSKKKKTKSGLELSSSSGGEAGESPPTFNNVAPPPPNMFSAAAPKKTEEKSKKKKTKSGLELSSSSGDEAGESPPTFNNVAPPPVNMFGAVRSQKTPLALSLSTGSGFGPGKAGNSAFNSRHLSPGEYSLSTHRSHQPVVFFPPPSGGFLRMNEGEPRNDKGKGHELNYSGLVSHSSGHVGSSQSNENGMTRLQIIDQTESSTRGQQWGTRNETTSAENRRSSRQASPENPPRLSACEENIVLPKKVSPSELLKRETDEFVVLRQQTRLPRSHVQAHLPFKHYCESPPDGLSRDWNEEFQICYLDYMYYSCTGAAYRERFKRFLEEFEEFSKKLVETYFNEASKVQEAIARSPDGCVRVGNLVFRMWKDAKLGMNMQRCFNAVFQARAPQLHFPLTATFRYFHVSISVQALVPLLPDAKPVYRGDGPSDIVCDIPLREYLQHLLNSLNVNLVTSEKLANISGLEVYEGLDGKYYILNALGILPPLRKSNTKAVPLRRWQTLILEPHVNTYYPPSYDSYKKGMANILYILHPIAFEPKEKRFETLVKLLHGQHFNVCLLGLIIQRILSGEKDEPEESVAIIIETICIEMLCRTLRDVMCQEAHLKYVRFNLQHISNCFTRAIGILVCTSAKECVRSLLPHMEEKFILERKSSQKTLTIYLEHVVERQKEMITRRLGQLCGLQLTRGQVSLILAVPSSHNLMSFFGSDYADFVSKITHSPTCVSTQVRLCMAVPSQVERYCLSDRIQDAWQAAKKLVAERTADLSSQFVDVHFWIVGALLGARSGEASEALRLIEKSRLVMESVSAYTLVSRVGRSQLPHYPFYVLGLVRTLQFEGLVRCFLKDFTGAEKCGEAALVAIGNFDRKEITQAVVVKEELMVLFVEIGANCTQQTDLVRIDNIWETERDKRRYSLRSSRINELFGSLFFQKGMYPHASIRLTDCLGSMEKIFGEQSAPVAEILNKLSFVYYNWNVKSFGLLCSCLLHRAEDTTIAVYGRYSPTHLGVVENIIVLFIERELYTVASRRLHQIKKLPPRYALRIPKDHPTLIHLPELERKLKQRYKNRAATIIQRVWKEYALSLLLKGAREHSALLIQKVGRGFTVRKAFNASLHGIGNIDTIERKQLMYIFLSASKPLLTSSTMFNQMERDWNGDFQHVRLFGMWMGSEEGNRTLQRLHNLEQAFRKRAEECVTLYEQGRLETVRVPGCENSFLCGNIVFTKVARQAYISTIQNDIFRHIRQELLNTVTAPLSVMVDSEKLSYVAEALLPLRRQPEFILTSDGRQGPQCNQNSLELINEMMRTLQRPFPRHVIQGVEIIRGAENLCYVTNGLGLVLDPAVGKYDGPPIAELPHSFFFSSIQLCINDKPKLAVEQLEKYVLSLTSRSLIMIYETLLLYIRLACSFEKGAEYKLFFQSLEEVEGVNLILPAILGSYHVACAAINAEEYKDALLYLNNVFSLLKKTRLHAYFASFITLECSRRLQQVSLISDKRIDAGVIEMIHGALSHGQPSPLLFATFERFIRYHKQFEEYASAEYLSELRYTRAKCQSPEYMDYVIEELTKASENQNAKEINERHKESKLYLSTCIHLIKVHRDNSKELGLLLTRFGTLLTAMNDLPDARKSLTHAYNILSVEAPFGPEMQIWKKHYRTLKIRIKERAVEIIRRAVRRWKEKKMLEAEMKEKKPEEYNAMQLVRRARRLDRLIVVESTARVYIADAETEDWYQLLRRQHRMRNEAMVRELFRCTYGRRVQIYNEKMQSALRCLEDYALTCKQTMMTCFLDIQRDELISFFHKAYRIGRRDIITEWHADRFSLKLYHLQYVETIARNKYEEARVRFIFGLLAVEERTWRRVILSNFQTSKDQMGKYIGKKLHASNRPKKQYSDERALIIDEERKREKIMLAEERAFRDFTFGPEVQSDDDD